jgi:hypothetical protein
MPVERLADSSCGGIELMVPVGGLVDSGGGRIGFVVLEGLLVFVAGNTGVVMLWGFKTLAYP